MKEGLVLFLAKQWEALLQKGFKISFRKGQILFYEGHQPYGLFVVLSGEVTLTPGKKRCIKDHTWQSPHGLVLGLHPLIESSSFCCTGVASTDCELVFIPKTTVTHLAKPDKEESLRQNS